jgi:hypothetical protein
MIRYILYAFAVFVLALIPGSEAQIINPPPAPQNIVQGSVSFTDTAAHLLVAAPGTNWYLYITQIGCYSVSAAGTFSLETIQNGSGGSTLYNSTVSGAGGGFNTSFPIPIGGHAMTVNTAIYVQGTTALTTVYCNASGYRGP